MFSCDSLGGVLGWDLRRSQEPALSWDLTPAALHSVTLDSAGLLLACGRGDGLISLLDTSPNQQVRPPQARALTDTPSLQEWSLDGHEQEWSLDGHEQECVWSVVFSPSADSLFSSAANGSVVIWR